MGATRLDENTAWINLATLALTENQITYEGEKALSLNAAWAALNSLQFGGNVGTKGIFALSKNRNWRGLKTLSLKDNLIGDKGVRHIIINNDFSGNNVNASSLFALAHHQPWRHLRKLSLSSNAIDLEGVKYLSLIPQWGNLKLLDLSYNMISDDGAKALCNYAKFQKLKTLNLRKNGISYEGVKSLSKNASLVKLEILDLTENKIDSKSTKTMAKIFQHWKNLQLLFEVKEAEDNVQEGIQTEGRDVAEILEEKTSQLNEASHLKSIFKLGREKGFEECDALVQNWYPNPIVKNVLEMKRIGLTKVKFQTCFASQIFQGMIITQVFFSFPPIIRDNNLCLRFTMPKHLLILWDTIVNDETKQSDEDSNSEGTKQNEFNRNF